MIFLKDQLVHAAIASSLPTYGQNHASLDEFLFRLTLEIIPKLQFSVSIAIREVHGCSLHYRFLEYTFKVEKNLVLLVRSVSAYNKCNVCETVL
jgi:hypothetical protein